MKKTKRLWALLLVMVMALGLITTAFAAPTIDSGRKASLSLYKYDITAASADGAWDAASYALLASGEAERSRLWKKRRTSVRLSRCRCTSGFGRSRSSGARPWPTTSRTYSENILKEEHEL